jgi:hypothetical protein
MSARGETLMSARSGSETEEAATTNTHCDAERE